MMAKRTRFTVAKSLVAMFIVSPEVVIADCLGPPSSPVLKIDIRDCEVARQFDNTLKIVGYARQVLTLYFPHATASENFELVLEDKVISDDSFWASVAPGEGCKEFLDEAEEIWLFGDICNDTGQNIPDLQITPLWPEIKQIAMQLLAAAQDGDT